MIRQHTRQSDIVFNTEYAKIHVPDVSTDADERVTEERLADEVLNLKVAEVRALCKQCGLDSKGSKMDLVLRLREKMASRTTYNKVFEKVWGASGGWAVVMCPCGVVYSVKFNLRAESPRDFTDMLLSWKHFPNVTVYDYARGLASHANCRQPLDPPFHPHEGRLLHPSPENIKLAAERMLRVDLAWLKHRKEEEDKDCHPITGSASKQRDDDPTTDSSYSKGPPILNSCLKGIKVFSANSYVAHTWFIPSVQNPEQHLPDKADDFQWILVPVWHPGHWTICLLANLFGIIPLLVVLQFCSVQKQVALLVSPGPWREFCANDIQYALYFLDMEHLRRWWCMLLIDNFPVTFEGRGSSKRRLEREDCEDSPRKKDPLAKTAAEILVSSEEEDGEKHRFISSAMAASQWCSAKNMGDKVILPQILSMAPLDREAALHNLGEASNLRDEDSWEDRMDPFMFRFKFESDYLMFFEQCIDKENLKVHACFEERG
ncbi:hypothetical protein JOQ06_002633 [Pogonophryne albipinna]|uniref:SAP domain-containing protein n=1 Tax=Pogonophryne albipinna TaxID=1090488 RepID=A0AAD6B867_9TELE|nr:hypothetical protein JOQ06_002633 [Pogonophryne albipinna]